jgi:hypothetical protein
MPQTQNDQSNLKPPHWKEDKLKRWEQAAFLTHFLLEEHHFLIERSQQAKTDGFEPRPRHFVLNIDSPWGFGKTFFLNRWKTDLEKADHLVLTFNAWENDFSKDPLLSFLSEISSQLAQKLKEDSGGSEGAGASRNAVNFQKMRQKSIALLKNHGPNAALRLAFFAATGLPPLWAGTTGSVDGGEQTEGEGASSVPPVDGFISNQSYDLFQEENARKQAVDDFRDELTVLIQSIKEHHNAFNRYYKLPVFILIDELDRCRPDFTIELIEMVKHIFSVDDLFFVFATDGEQLQASLAGLYGERFDAELYFKRIFTREMHLRRPDNGQFTRSLIAEYSILREENSVHWLINVTAHQRDIEAFISDFVWVADAFDLTLRDQHQLAASFDSVFRFRQFNGQKTCTAITLILLVFWQKRKELFKRLLNSPESFTGEIPLADHLRQHFAHFDPALKVETARPGAQSGLAEMSIPNVISEFVEILQLSGEQLSRKVSSNELQFGFTRLMAVDAREGPGSEQLQSKRPFMSYFDQIMIAG